MSMIVKSGISKYFITLAIIISVVIILAFTGQIDKLTYVVYRGTVFLFKILEIVVVIITTLVFLIFMMIEALIGGLLTEIGIEIGWMVWTGAYNEMGYPITVGLMQMLQTAVIEVEIQLFDGIFLFLEESAAFEFHAQVTNVGNLSDSLFGDGLDLIMSAYVILQSVIDGIGTIIITIIEEIANLIIEIAEAAVDIVDIIVDSVADFADWVGGLFGF